MTVPKARTEGKATRPSAGARRPTHRSPCSGRASAARCSKQTCAGSPQPSARRRAQGRRAEARRVWDGALLRPASQRDEEREEGAVLDWHAPVQRQHLGEDMEDIGYVFCDKSISDWPEIGQNDNTRSILLRDFCEWRKERGFENRDRV